MGHGAGTYLNPTQEGAGDVPSNESPLEGTEPLVVDMLCLERKNCGRASAAAAGVPGTDDPGRCGSAAAAAAAVPPLALPSCIASSLHMPWESPERHSARHVTT